MKTRACFGFLTVLTILVLLAGSCGGSQTTTTSTSTSSGTTTQSTTTSTGTTTTSASTTSTPTTTTPTTTTSSTTTSAATTMTTTTTTATTTTSGDSLESILGLSVNVSTVKYDMVMTSPGTAPMTQTIWLKGKKMRTEMTAEGQTTVMLIDLDTRIMYMYMPAQNMAIRMNMNDTVPTPANDEAQSVTDFAYTVIGTENYDGKSCLVVEYTSQGTVTRMWVWKENGYPVKVEMTAAGGKSVIEYKNFDFGDIPDSMFVLPDGVSVVQM